MLAEHRPARPDSPQAVAAAARLGLVRAARTPWRWRTSPQIDPDALESRTRHYSGRPFNYGGHRHEQGAARFRLRQRSKLPTRFCSSSQLDLTLHAEHARRLRTVPAVRGGHRAGPIGRQSDGSDEADISLKKAEETLKLPISWDIPNATKPFRPRRRRGCRSTPWRPGSRPHQAILEIAKAHLPFGRGTETAKPRRGIFAACSKMPSHCRTGAQSVQHRQEFSMMKPAGGSRSCSEDLARSTLGSRATGRAEPSPAGTAPPPRR